MANGSVEVQASGAFGAAGYVRRIVDDDLDVLAPQLPAILLDGAKGTGKTATALQRARTVRRLDTSGPLAIARADPDTLLTGAPPVLLDEWQHAPQVWDAVKRAVDTDNGGGRFLLTGSAPLPGVRTHSGAGRITAVRMRPLTLPERGASRPTVSLRALLSGERTPVNGECGLDLRAYVDQILGSGMPGLQSLEGQALCAALDGYVDRIVERDLEEAGWQVRRPETIRAWLRAYAAATATAASWEKIRDAARAGSDTTPTRSTILPYIDALSALRILDDLPAWVPGGNPLRRLTQGPKHHLADTALAARLLDVDRDDLLAGADGVPSMPRDGTLLGAFFESLATMSVRVFAQANAARVGHLRTRDSEHEVDLIVQRGGRVVAFEVKLSAAIDDQDVKHLRWLRDQIGDQLLDAAVLTTGPQAYRRKDGIAVIPLGLLGP